MIQHKNIAIWGASLLVLSITLGALGAHALEKILSPERLKSFLTGNQYLSLHGLAFLILALFPKFVKKPAKLILTGLLLFSFSIFALVILGHTNTNFPKALALITPLGGMLMMLGWAWLAVQIFKTKIDGVAI